MDEKLLEEEDLLEVEESQFDELGTTPFILTDENITQDQINEMKSLGIDKPDTVSYERWWQLQSCRFEHEHIIHLAASGMPQWMIAQQTGYSEPHISKVLNTPEMKVKVQDKVKDIYGVDYAKAVKDLSLKAIGVVSDSLDKGSEKIRADMAKYVIDHSIGKASQEIVEKKTSLTEVIIKIDQLRSSQLRDVGSGQSLLPKDEDPFDNVINEVIPKGMVIGKRSSGEG